MLGTISLSFLVSFFVFLAVVKEDRAAGIRYVSHKNCNNLARGKIIPHPVNCSQYIMCNGLRSTLGECPEGQYYNADMLSCDKLKTQCQVTKEKEIIGKPTNTSATSSSIKKTTKAPNTTFPTKVEVTSQRPFTTVSTTTALPMYVDGRPLCSLWQDLQFPHPYNCVYYYQCVKGFLTIRRCYSGYIWYLTAQRCLPEALGHCPSIRRAGVFIYFR